MDTEEVAETTTNQNINHLISINELASPDTEFVSLDINEIEATGTINSSCVNSEIPSNTNTQLSTMEQQLKQKQIQLEQMQQELKTKYGESVFDGGAIQTIEMDFDDDKSMNTDKTANWPHPSFAYLYHNIEADIPKSKQYLVQTAYKTWKLTSIGYVLNLICITIAAFHDNFYESGLQKSQNVFTSLLWVCIAIPVGFLLWYMNLYRISKKFSTKNWLVFTVSFACHIVFTVIILSGCPWYPCAGVFFTITCFFSGYTGSTILGLFNCTMWSVVLILSLSVSHSVKGISSNNKEKQIEEVKGDLKTTVASIVNFAM